MKVVSSIFLFLVRKTLCQYQQVHLKGNTPLTVPNASTPTIQKQKFYDCVGSQCPLINRKTGFCRYFVWEEKKAEQECWQNKDCEGIVKSSLQSSNGNWLTRWSLVKSTTNSDSRCNLTAKQFWKQFGIGTLFSIQQRALRIELSNYFCAGEGQCLNTDTYQPNANVLCSVNYKFLENAISRCNILIQQNKRCDGYISYERNGASYYELVNKATGRMANSKCEATKSFQTLGPTFVTFQPKKINVHIRENWPIFAAFSTDSFATLSNKSVSAIQQRALRTKFSKYSCAGDGQCLKTDIYQPSENVLCSVNYMFLEDAEFRCNRLTQQNKRCDGYIFYERNGG